MHWLCAVVKKKWLQRLQVWEITNERIIERQSIYGSDFSWTLLTLKYYPSRDIRKEVEIMNAEVWGEFFQLQICDKHQHIIVCYNHW